MLSQNRPKRTNSVTGMQTADQKLYYPVWLSIPEFLMKSLALKTKHAVSDSIAGGGFNLAQLSGHNLA